MEQTIKILSQIPGYFDHFIAVFLIFVRLISFFQVCPIFRRKEVLFMSKIGLSLLFSVALLASVKIDPVPQDVPFIWLIIMNILVGFFIGLITRMIFDTIQAAGDLANNQMSLSSASMFDPSTRVQTSIMGQVYQMLGMIVFISIGGFHWLFSAVSRSFEIFPLMDARPDFTVAIPLDYWILISGNVIFIGFQIVAPIVITTLAIDIILGIISKTAPQINVFQLSFVFKPVVGCAVLLASLPLFIRVLEDFFISQSQFY